MNEIFKDFIEAWFPRLEEDIKEMFERMMEKEKEESVE